MFRSIKIRNFRKLQSVDLSYLSRINLLTGTNGAGKTSVLEAAFLNCGANNAGLAGKLSLFRDDFELSSFSDRLFKGLFPGYHPKKKIVIEVLGDPRKRHAKAKRVLRISPAKSAIGAAPSTDEEPRLSGLNFIFNGPSGRSKGTLTWESVESAFTPDGREVKGITLTTGGSKWKDVLSANFITPYYRGLWPQTHKQLTELVKQRKISKAVELLKFIVPDLRNLQPLTEDGVNVIYADIGGETLLPASLLGAGFVNVLRIVLTAVTNKNGIILIDEIEDGLHFSVIDDLIQIIFRLSKENNLQFFISSHSEEVLSSFSRVSKKLKFKDISAYRLSSPKGKVVCTRFSRNEFLQATDIRAEIR